MIGVGLLQPYFVAPKPNVVKGKRVTWGADVRSYVRDYEYRVEVRSAKVMIDSKLRTVKYKVVSKIRK